MLNKAVRNVYGVFSVSELPSFGLIYALKNKGRNRIVLDTRIK